MILVSQRPNTV